MICKMVASITTKVDLVAGSWCQCNTNIFIRNQRQRKEGNVSFNGALKTFYLRLYDVRYMVNDDSDSEKENQLPPHWLLFPISNNGSFMCIIPETG